MNRNQRITAAQLVLLVGSGLPVAISAASAPSAQLAATQAKASPAIAAISASAMLAREWQDGLNPALYLVSEKLDGVRALWDGQTLRFRSGRPISAPAWFVSGLPKTPLDGELWIARHSFDQVSGAVRRNVAVDAEWRAVHYMVFDLPMDSRVFAKRVAAIAHLVEQTQTPWLHAVAQKRIDDEVGLRSLLAELTAQGGEGLMLHRRDALWKAGRSDDLRKLKAQPDEEGKVLGHIAGKGKLKGRMGALLLQAPDGQHFSLGSGFSDSQREEPPAVGSVVTYRYRDRTAGGLPRFATYLRAHDSE